MCQSHTNRSKQQVSITVTRTTPHALKQRRATAEASMLPQYKHEDDFGPHPASSVLTTQEHLSAWKAYRLDDLPGSSTSNCPLLLLRLCFSMSSGHQLVLSWALRCSSKQVLQSFFFLTQFLQQACIFSNLLEAYLICSFADHVVYCHPVVLLKPSIQLLRHRTPV